MTEIQPPQYDTISRAIRDSDVTVDWVANAHEASVMRAVGDAMREEILSKDHLTVLLRRADESDASVDVVQLTPVQRATVRQPAYTNTSDLPARFTDAAPSLPGVRVAVFHGAFLFGKYGAIVADTGEYVTLSTAVSKQVETAAAIAVGVAEGPYDSQSTTRVDVALPLFGVNDRNYFHWIIDYLPRLRAFDWYQSVTGESPVILVRERIPEWAVSMLKALGYWGYVECVDPGVVIAERLLVMQGADLAGRSGESYLQPAQLEWLRRTVRTACGVDTGSVPVGASARVDPGESRIGLFVSREAMKSRWVVNRDAVIAALPDWVRVVQPERLSFDEQVALFDAADVIVGAHGAGLTNALWATDAGVVEILGEFQNPAFHQLANVAGHEYACVQCDEPATELTVDVGEVVRAFDRVTPDCDTAPRLPDDGNVFDV